MDESLNFLARIAAMLQSFLFHLECCHRFITWLFLNIMNCKFQTVFSFLFLSSYEKTYHKICVWKTEEIGCFTVFFNSAHTQKSGNWHSFLPIHIPCFFFYFQFLKKSLGNSGFNSQILLLIRYQLPYSFCDFEQFFWACFHISKIKTFSFLFTSLYYCDSLLNK